MRNIQLHRAFSLIDCIRSGGRRGKTMTEISREIEIPIRTLYRYLEAITPLQPIYTERDGKKIRYKWLGGAE